MKSKIFAICLGVIGVSTLAVAEGLSSNSSTPSDSGDRNVSVRIADGSNGVKFVFTRDRSIPALGKAWKDPSGMIWGDIVRTALGTVNEMDYSSAVEYCKRINAKLPSKEDFVRLREYMGAIPGGIFLKFPQDISRKYSDTFQDISFGHLRFRSAISVMLIFLMAEAVP